MKVTTTKRTEQTFEIELPAFFKRKDGQSFLAVFDESEVIKIYANEKWTSLQCGAADLFHNEITEAYNEWLPSHEQEFRIEYEKALKQIAIPKHQITTAELSIDDVVSAKEESDYLSMFHD